MSKRLAVTLLSIGIAALVGVLIWGIAGRGSMWQGVLWGQSWGTEPEQSVAVYQAAASGIDTLSVRLASEDVTVRPGDGSTILVEQFARGDLPEEYQVRVAEDGRRLAVESGLRGRVMLFGQLPYSHVEITLPQRLADTLSVETASGEVDIEGIEAGAVDASAASGSVVITNTGTNSVQCGTMSGEVDIDGVKADTVDASTASGAATITNTDAKSVKCATASGDVRVDIDACDLLSASSTSGSVSVRSDVRQDVELSSTSGDVRMDGSAESAGLSTMSGDITGEYRRLSRLVAGSTSGSIDVSIADAAQLKSVEASTMSGDVSLAVPPGTAVSTDFSSVSGTMRTQTSGGSIEIRDTGVPIAVDTTSGDFELRTTA